MVKKITKLSIVDGKCFQTNDFKIDLKQNVICFDLAFHKTGLTICCQSKIYTYLLKFKDKYKLDLEDLNSVYDYCKEFNKGLQLIFKELKLNFKDFTFVFEWSPITQVAGPRLSIYAYLLIQYLYRQYAFNYHIFNISTWTNILKEKIKLKNWKSTGIRDKKEKINYLLRQFIACELNNQQDINDSLGLLIAYSISS